MQGEQGRPGLGLRVRRVRPRPRPERLTRTSTGTGTRPGDVVVGMSPEAPTVARPLRLVELGEVTTCETQSPTQSRVGLAGPSGPSRGRGPMRVVSGSRLWEGRGVCQSPVVGGGPWGLGTSAPTPAGRRGPVGFGVVVPIERWRLVVVVGPGRPSRRRPRRPRRRRGRGPEALLRAARRGAPTPASPQTLLQGWGRVVGKVLTARGSGKVGG